LNSDLDHHLAAIQAGDAEAFGAWLAGAEAPLRRSLRSFAAAVDTEAVLQESLLRVWQVAPKLNQTGENSLLRLAYRITRNHAIDVARRNRVTSVDPSTLPEDIDMPSAPDPLLRRAIAECRRHLPRTPSRALTARLSAGFRSDADVAAELNMKPNTYFQNIRRARKLLADCLAKRGVDLAGVMS
jgi:DNA-directed RNA polymerase specialized sigma24 family protein